MTDKSHNVEEVVEEFDAKFAHQDKVQDEIPLADMHDWLRTALQQQREAGAREGERKGLEIAQYLLASHDPQRGNKSSPAYWGNTLADALEAARTITSTEKGV